MKSEHRKSPKIETLGRWIIRWRWAIIIATMAIVIAAGSDANRIEFNNDYRVFFSKENPQLLSFEALQNIYTKDDNIQFVLSSHTNDLFSADFLEAVSWLTDEAWKLPFTTRVDSLTNFQHSEAEGDDLLVDDLVSSPRNLSAEDLAKIESVAYNDPLLYNRLVGDKRNVTGVNVTLTLPEEDTTEGAQAAIAAWDLSQRFEVKFPEIKVYLTGVVMLNNAFGESAIGDMSTLIPLMYLSIIITMGVLLRSVTGTIGSFTVIIITTVTAIGLMGWLGIDMSAPVSSAPTMIMTLAVADSIHFLVTFLQQMRLGRTKHDALVESLRTNFQPILLTSITTAVGFLSMNFSDVPPFRHLGNVVAIGVMAGWLFPTIFLPAFVAVLPVRVTVKEESESGLIDRFAEYLIRNRSWFLWGPAVVVVVMATLIPRLELNDQFVNYFDERVTFRTDTDYAMDNLTGIYSLQYSLNAEDSGGISNPAYLKKLDEFATWYRQQPGVMQVITLSDTMKRLNKNLHGDDPAYYKIPDNRELAAQYLLLFEMSLPYGLDLNNQINVDKSATRFTITLANLTTSEIRFLLEKADTWLSENAPAYMRATAASQIVMFTYISERNVKSMIGGSVFAVIIISFILIFALRSTKYGIIILIPNIAPAVLGFGTWALFVGEMGLSLSIVTGMTLGIVVDDTVHFLSKYNRAQREHALSAEDSVRFVFQRVGKALIVTTVILVIGFGTLSLSAFRLNAWMGQLTAIVIIFALFADFLFLPALLITLDKLKQYKPQPTEDMKGIISHGKSEITV